MEQAKKILPFIIVALVFTIVGFFIGRYFLMNSAQNVLYRAMTASSRNAGTASLPVSSTDLSNIPQNLPPELIKALGLPPTSAPVAPTPAAPAKATTPVKAK